MKVRINYVVDVDDDFRKSVNLHYGRPGLASRQQIKQWFEQFGKSMDDDLALDRQATELWEAEHR